MVTDIWLFIILPLDLLDFESKVSIDFFELIYLIVHFLGFIVFGSEDFFEPTFSNEHFIDLLFLFLLSLLLIF